MAKAISLRSVVALAVLFVAPLSIVTLPSRLTSLPALQALSLMLPAGHRELVRIVPERERADRDLARGERIILPGAVFYVPPSFRSDDGQFDLLVHFHGNTELLAQSVAQAGLNAIVYVVNTGNGARRYASAFAAPAVFDGILKRSARLAAEQGLRHARPRRVALSAWSAGFAAIGQILRHRAQHIDAVLLLDGLHAPFEDGASRRPDPGALAPFVEFSAKAAAGERLLVITHSKVETYTYASTAQTADAILGANHLERVRVEGEPLVATFDAARRATPRHHHDGLVPASRAQRKGLHVQGFRGDRAEHHIAHLVQMSLTALPPLLDRWRIHTM